VLADDGEQIAEQRALAGGEVLGDLVQRRSGTSRLVGAELDVAAPIGRRPGPLRR
jgi:hypothetical protein